MNYNRYINNKISYICKNEYKFFFSKSNVVGVGRGYKFKNGFYTCEPCIIIFVIRKLSSNEIPDQDLIPPMYKGISTDVVESGIMSTDFHDEYNNLNNSLQNRIRPVLGGYGIGPATKSVAGTMGCVVTDRHSNFILSCNHVLAYNNMLPLATAIVQPSLIDGGKSPNDIVAGLSEFVPISFSSANLVDAAIARILNKKNVSSKIALVNHAPKGVKTPNFGVNVQKVGRSTGLTKGKIRGVDTTYRMYIHGKDVVFKNQIILTCMSIAGDSGAVLLDEQGYALGLIMAGGNVSTIANTFSDVLKSLNVLLVLAS